MKKFLLVIAIFLSLLTVGTSRSNAEPGFFLVSPGTLTDPVNAGTSFYLTINGERAAVVKVTAGGVRFSCLIYDLQNRLIAVNKNCTNAAFALPAAITGGYKVFVQPQRTALVSVSGNW